MVEGSAAGSDTFPLVVLAGATASGKTALSLRLAEEFGGEIVSCDSVAVYRGMEIGTAKPSPEERARVRHHCLDLYWPNEVCTAGDYARHARAAIAEIRGRDRLPIVTGGTGLYLRALLEGLAPAPPRNAAMRERLSARSEDRGSAWLHRLLARLDPAAATLIHPNDTPKLIRSIEVTLAARRPQTEQWRAGREPLRGFRVLTIGLDPPRAALRQRIDTRAAAMFDRGLVEETAELLARFGGEAPSLRSLGYAQATAVLRGEMSRAEAVAGTQAGHRQYAKRQLTWFRNQMHEATEMHWIEGFGDEAEVERQALHRARALVAGSPASGMRAG